PHTDGRYISYCPDGWYYYKLSCFKYFTDSRTWDEAESQCQEVKEGAHLAWVEDSREAATLRRAISYYQRVQPVWIGLQKTKEVRCGRQGWWGLGDSRAMLLNPPLPAQSQVWQWTTGKGYSASEIPGNGAQGGSCAMLTHHSVFSVWSSAECSRKHHYICKFYP
ncbi:REG4 protein, partial [Brachypodius atriceps]|nr:REG4 protein [Brachypodius atriceps]